MNTLTPLFEHVQTVNMFSNSRPGAKRIWYWNRMFTNLTRAFGIHGIKTDCLEIQHYLEVKYMSLSFLTITNRLIHFFTESTWRCKQSRRRGPTPDVKDVPAISLKIRMELYWIGKSVETLITFFAENLMDVTFLIILFYNQPKKSTFIKYCYNI